MKTTIKLESGNKFPATGVEVHGSKLRIIFYYKSVKCSESLDLENTPQNIKIASQKRADVLSDIRRGKFNYLEHFPNSKRAKLFEAKPKSYYIKDLLLEQMAVYINSKKYAENTIRDYVRYIENELIPEFGKYQVHELSPLIIKGWIIHSTQTSKYVSNMIIPLRAMLDDAKNMGIITDNPLDRLSLKRLFQCFEDHSDYEVEPFTVQEKRLLLNGQYAEQVINLIKFGFYSGLRIGEILALQWSQFNLESRKINVEFTLVNGKLHKPKTKNSIRELVLLEQAYQAIIDQMKFNKADKFIFNNPNTQNMWLSTDAFRKHWVKLLDSLGVKYRNPYQMRHTFASMMLSKGENPLKVAKYLGHKDTEMVTKIYGKYIPINESEENCFIGNYED